MIMTYLQLFYEFFKTGLFAIGGGLATLPFLTDMADRLPQWFSRADLADMVAISESTPGPIGVNMATYVGYKVAGIPGGILATIGLVLPSLVIIIIVAGFMKRFSENRYVKQAFYGLRPAVTGLIAAAGYGVFRISVLTIEQFKGTGAILDLVNWKALALFAAIFALSRWKKKWHPVIWIAAGGLVGWLLKI